MAVEDDALQEAYVKAYREVRGRAAPAAGPAERASRRSSLAGALAALQPEDRAVVLLVDAKGFDDRAAADVLGVPQRTIGSRLHRARAGLRRALRDTRTGASNR
jgi:DNA-directed RNA polymerase specialized sigma24 family protein